MNCKCHLIYFDVVGGDVCSSYVVFREMENGELN